MTEGTIEPRRAAVVRGQVLSRDNQPISGVTITVKDHPEFGATMSRADGTFDMAVNGGGLLTVNYEKSGFLPVQRQIQTPWQDFAIFEDVVMVPLDAQVTSIDLAGGTAMQVAEGSTVTDADGSRQATVLFPQGTAATMTLPDGTTQALSTLHVRATEYTVGENGPKAMPSPLPPSSGYTYAVELSVDEAIAAGAKRVDFNQPLPVYVDNFLGFPVGGIVPVGWYDREKAAWIPSENGRIVTIWGVDAEGLAQLDIDGTGEAAGATALAALGISDAERRELAQLYASGKSLWRVPITHFTPWDFNWPYGPPPDAEPPPAEEPETGDEDQPDTEDSDPCKGCIIEAQSQTLGEEIRITGTPFKLHYRSDRVRGRKTGNTLAIPLSAANVPSNLKRIDLKIAIAGRHYSQSFAATPNLSPSFDWDGRDAYGRAVSGRHTATIEVVYVYGAVYYAPAGLARAFGMASSVAGRTSIGGNRSAGEIALTKRWEKQLGGLGRFTGAAVGLGGWSLTVHHAYDVLGQVLHGGDGSHRSGTSVGAIIETVVGNGRKDGFTGDGGPATEAALPYPIGVALGADGSLYIADPNNRRVRHVSPDGIISTVAGSGHYGFSGDGGPANQAAMRYPSGVALGADGSLYIVDRDNHRIRRVSSDGIISTVAGNGQHGFSGDGGPATEAAMRYPGAVALGADGSLYIADTNNVRIRRVSSDGIISTVAGNGQYGFSGDDGPATQAALAEPLDIAIGPDGSLYIADTDNHRIRRVAPDGIIGTVAGNGQRGFSGDGGPATEAGMAIPACVALGPDGSLYIADFANSRVRRVSPDGIITTVTGNGQLGFSGDGGPATQAKLWYPGSLGFGPDRSLYIADHLNARIRRVRSQLASASLRDIVLASADGTEAYHFDPSGRHLRTFDTVTGKERYTFAYDEHGWLMEVKDLDGDLTRIERDAYGHATGILSADGQRTPLALDAKGYLASVTNPAGETHRMEYAPEGLLTAFTDPKGHVNRFEYGVLGRLISDTNAGGGGWTIARTEDTHGYTHAMSTREGRTTAFRVEPLPTGDRRQVNTYPDGTVQAKRFKTNGEETTTAPDGTITMVLEGPDPRFGMQAPIPSSISIKLPSGLTSTATTARTVSVTDRDDPASLRTLTDTRVLNGKAYRRAYDAATRTWTTSSAAGRQITSTLNPQGRPITSQVAGLEAIQYAYDARGRLTESTVGQGAEARTTTRHYFEAGPKKGYLESLTDALGRSTGFDYDRAGRVIRQTLPDGRAIHFEYDANGNVIFIVPPGQPPHRFDYTVLDQEAEYTPPAIGQGDPTTRYRYNLDKQLARITRPDGQMVEMSYEAGGKLDVMRIPTGEYRYDYHPSTGQPSAITSPEGGTLRFTFDGFLPKSTTWSGEITGSLTRTYDPDFRVTGLSVNGEPMTFGYDADGLLTHAGTLTLTRDAQNGLLTGTTLGNTTTTVGYNGFGELASDTAMVSGTKPYQATYFRDRVGRITEKVETTEGLTTTYGYSYDLAGRLAEVKQNGVVASMYRYDENGNRTHVNDVEVAHYDAQDRLLDYQGTTYTYTPNGELASNTEGAFPTTYDYDVLGALRSVELPDGRRIDYLIDGQNRRIGKKLNGTLVQGFLYQDPLRPIAELDANNNVVSRFVYADKANVPAYLEKSGVTYRIISDHLGSPRLVVKADTGDIVQRMDYDAWGRVTLDTNPGFQPFGFAGGLYDRDTKLVRFGARDYDPETGRWTAKDPIRFAGGDANLYEYVAGDPVRWADASGLNPAAGAIGGGAIAGPPGALVGGVIGFGVGLYIGDRMFSDDGGASDAPNPTPPIPDNAGHSPGEGWVWKGSGPPESGKGNWVNPDTGQKLHPDLNHPLPKGPHWGLTNPDESKWDFFPGSGKWEECK